MRTLRHRDQHVALVHHPARGLAQVGQLQLQRERAQEDGIGLHHPRVEPRVPCVVEDALARDLGRDAEAGIEPGLERPLAQERAGEGVDGRDGRTLEVVRGREQALALGRVARGSIACSMPSRRRSFSSPAAFSVNVIATMRSSVARPEAHDRQDARDQDGRLPRAGARFEQERRVEVADDAVANGLVGGNHARPLARKA